MNYGFHHVGINGTNVARRGLIKPLEAWQMLAARVFL